MKKKLDTPEEKKHAELRDAIIKERPQEWDHIQKERQKISKARNKHRKFKKLWKSVRARKSTKQRTYLVGSD